MIQKFIRIGQLATRPDRPGRLPLSPNSIWRLAREGKFPKPVKLSDAVTAWRLEDIEAWEKSKLAAKWPQSGLNETHPHGSVERFIDERGARDDN